MRITNRNANKQQKQTTKKKKRKEKRKKIPPSHTMQSQGFARNGENCEGDFRWLCITLLCVLKSTTETKDRINSKYGNGNGTIFV